MGDRDIVAVIKRPTPIDDVLLVVLEARRVGDGAVLQRGEAPVPLGAEAQGLDRLRAVAEAEDHLLPCERNPDRALQADRRQRCQEQLILRAQAGAEAAAHEGRQNADLVLGETEDIADVVVAVLRALRLVVDGEAVIAPNRRASKALHGIMMLDGRAVFLFDPDRRQRQGLIGIAAGRDWRHGRHALDLGHVSLLDLRIDVGNSLLCLIFDDDQRRRVAGDLELLRHDERDRLPGKEDILVVERAEWRAGRGRLVRIFLARGGDVRAIVVGEHFEDARHGECGAPIDALDAALGDLAPDRDAVSEMGNIELGGIFRPARDLEMAIDPGYRLSKDARGDDVHGSGLEDHFDGLGLRRSGSSLLECAHDRPPRQLDLEVVMGEPCGALQNDGGGVRERLAVGPLALETLLGFNDAPGLMGDPA